MKVAGLTRVLHTAASGLDVANHTHSARARTHARTFSLSLFNVACEDICIMVSKLYEGSPNLIPCQNYLILAVLFLIKYGEDSVCVKWHITSQILIKYEYQNL